MEACLGKKVLQAETNKLFQESDVDSSGSLDKNEFVNLVASLEKKMGKLGNKWKRKGGFYC